MTEQVHTKVIESLGGSNIHIVFELPDSYDLGGPAFILMNSIVSLSYSVYRAKKTVFNLGETVLDGFSLGQKYVAGSIVKNVFFQDEMNDLLNSYVKKLGGAKSKNQDDNAKVVIQPNSATAGQSTNHLKQIHSIMKDDLTPFNIHAIYSSEYSDKYIVDIIYGANIINNGQVMSVGDLITETTFSFVARDFISGQDPDAERISPTKLDKGTTASQLLTGYNKSNTSKKNSGGNGRSTSKVKPSTFSKTVDRPQDKLFVKR